MTDAERFREDRFLEDRLLEDRFLEDRFLELNRVRLRRSWIRAWGAGMHGLLIGFCLTSLAAAGESRNARASEDDRPNILFLLADDLGWADLSCYGSKNTATPNLDRLAGEGARFTDFYAGAPNCSPSRAALLTGRSPARAGIYNYIPQDGPHYLRASEVTVAELLRDAGYETVHAGKWHLCHDLLSADLPQARDHGFMRSFATENNASPSHLNPVNFVRDGREVGKLEGYSADIVADEIITWLNEDRDRARPFFACAWFHETHAPIASPPDRIARHPEATQKDALYYANVENLDAAIGRVLAALDEAGEADTLVIFSSDNGGLRAESNGALRGRKSFVWEGGIRVPGIVRWPGQIEPGLVIAEPAGFVDVLPTLCAIGGVAMPDDLAVDGTDIRPLWDRGLRVERKTPLFWIFYRTRPAAAMRVGDWVIVGYPASKVPKGHAMTAEHQEWLAVTGLDRFELFDVRSDLSQEHDRSVEEPARFESMRAQLVELHAQAIAEGPRWEFEPK